MCFETGFSLLIASLFVVLFVVMFASSIFSASVSIAKMGLLLLLVIVTAPLLLAGYFLFSLREAIPERFQGASDAVFLVTIYLVFLGSIVYLIYRSI